MRGLMVMTGNDYTVITGDLAKDLLVVEKVRQEMEVGRCVCVCGDCCRFILSRICFTCFFADADSLVSIQLKSTGRPCYGKL